MRSVFLFVLTFFACSLLFADSTPDDPKVEETLKANVVDFRDWLMKELSQFPKVETNRRVLVSRKYFVPPKKNITASQYNQAAKSSWVKSQVMQELSVLSQQLSNTAGTAYAPQSASQLQQYSVQLQQSDDPQFQQVGTFFSQEAQALQTGNVQGADQAASQVAALPQPYVAPGYQPSQSESSLADTLHQIIGSIIGAVLEAAIAVYGGPVGISLASPAIQSVFGGGQNTGSVLAAGQLLSGQSYGKSMSTGFNPVTALTNISSNTIQPNGSVAIQQGSAALQQLGSVNVKQLQSQNSANAGGAPPAQ